MSTFENGPLPEGKDVFDHLTDSERETRIKAATARLQEMELQDIAEGNVVPAGLPQPDTYGPHPDDPMTYLPEDWEHLG